MKDHEHNKILRDTQYFKDRCDSALLALKKNEKELVELRQMRHFCDDVTEREDARIREELV